MSQEGIIDIIGNHPEIPIEFIADVGSAAPIANILELLGEVVLAGTNPFRSVGSGNTVTFQVQLAQAIPSTNATNVGLSAFNSSEFIVDANGFVSLIGGGSAIDSVGVDASTPPGTNPVVPSGLGLITVTGGQVAAGTTTNVIQTNSLAANTYTVQIQRSSAQATSTVGDNGVCHFSSAHFAVDSSGFVTLVGGGEAIDSIAVQTGTSPIVPTSGGQVTINGAVVAAGTNPVRSNGTGANTMALEVQISQAIASTDATKVGLASFNSTDFSVDANGFVSALGGAAFVYTNVTFGMSPYTVLLSDYYLSCDTSGGAITLRFPNSPTTTQRWVVKDRTGNSTVNNITLTTVGGVVTLDNLTSRVIAGNLGSTQVLFNATSYEFF